MPCAAGLLCKLKHLTPGPPGFTIHKCRCCGGYLHGICGVQDPLGSTEMNRICEGGCTTLSGDSSRAPPALKRAAPKQKAPALKPAGLKFAAPRPKPPAPKPARLEPPSSKQKARGAESRKRMSVQQQGEVLEYMQSKRAKVKHVAKHFGIGESTVFRIKKDADKIKKTLDQTPGLGRLKAIIKPKYDEVRNRKKSRCSTESYI